MSTERLPPPWTVVEHDESYEVRAANDVTVSYTYFDDEPTRRAITRRPTKDQARRIAAGIARLPELLQPQQAQMSLEKLQKPHEFQ